MADRILTSDAATEYREAINEIFAVPRVRVFNDAAQTVSRLSLKVLSFNQERYDDDGAGGGLHAAGQATRLTASKTGVWHVFGHVRWQGLLVGPSRDNGFRRLQINRNGFEAVASHRSRPGDQSDSASAAQLEQSLATEVFLTAGDYVELVVVHDNTASDAGSTDLQILASSTGNGRDNCEFGMSYRCA